MYNHSCLKLAKKIHFDFFTKLLLDSEIFNLPIDEIFLTFLFIFGEINFLTTLE